MFAELASGKGVKGSSPDILDSMDFCDFRFVRRAAAVSISFRQKDVRNNFFVKSKRESEGAYLLYISNWLISGIKSMKLARLLRLE